MSELEEKLARRRRWEDGRPPAPELPGLSASGGAGETSGKPSRTHRPAPPPPSVPARTYKSKLSREGSLQQSGRSLDTASEIVDGARHDSEASAASKATSTRPALLEALEGSSSKTLESDVADRGSPRSISSKGGSDRSLGRSDSDSSSQRPILLGKSGSNRHLMKQMEIINRTSPPIARVPLRTPPPVPTHHQPDAPKTERVPNRAPPPPPSSAPATTNLSTATSNSSTIRKAPPPLPHHIEIKMNGLVGHPPPLHSQAFDLNAPGSPSLVVKKPPAVPPVNKTSHQLSNKTLRAIEEMSHLRPLLIKFYLTHKQEKLPIIDKILAAYGMNGAVDGEDKLNEALRTEYGADLRSIHLGPGEETELLQQYQSSMRRPSVASVSTPGSSGSAAAAIAIMKEVVNDEADATKLLFARAIYRFEPQQEGDLGFEVGQIIDVTDNSKDWWEGSYKGHDKKEKKGVFPKNYVEEISESVVLSLRAAEESSKEKSFVGAHDVSTSSVQSSPMIMAAAQASARHRRGGSTSSSPPPSISPTLAKAAGMGPPERGIPDESIAPADLVTEDEYSPELVKDDIYVTHYFKSVFEMISSEFKYVTDLFLANQAFAQPFMGSLGKDRAEMLMPCWGDITRVHERLLGMLMETLPDVKVLERDFANNNTMLVSSPGHQGSAPTRRASYVMESSDVLDSVAGQSAPTLKSFAVKLDVLEDCYSRLLESGRFLSPSQRQERVSFISAWVARQSDVFNKFAPFLKAANPFISNYHNAVETLESFAGDELALLERLEQNFLLKNLKLRDFLIKPVQRVCKYPLLYREMIKYAQDEDTKLVAIKAQSNLMTIADQVNTMMKLNESGNAKKLQAIRACIRPQSDVDVYELHNSILRREGELTVVGCQGSSHAPELRAMTTLAGVLQAKPKGAVRGLLFQDQLLLVEVTTKFITKAERLKIVYGFHINQNWDSMKIDKQDTDGFSITLAHAQDGPAKGATITWSFKSPPAARDGWVESLLEMSERLERVRERMSLARQQEAKTENQRASKRKSSGSIDWDKTKLPAAPTVPSRGRTGTSGGLFSLIDELKTVQSIKFENVKKNIV